MDQVISVSSQPGLSIIELIANATLLVEVVIAILLLASLISWTMIFRKWLSFRHLTAAADEFEEEF